METLANKYRPKSLDEVVGQNHLIGENKILSNMVKNQKIFSMILYGKPGIGKTAIMEQIASEMGVGLLSYSMTHHTRQSALGLPFIEHKIYKE